MRDFISSSHQFQQWAERVRRNGSSLDRVEFLGAVSRDGRRMFSGFIDTVISPPDGDPQPRCMLIKGLSVMVVPWLTCQGNDYTLLVGQRRPVHGGVTWEFPGGMIEAAVEGPAAVAQTEVTEELGIDLNEGELLSLSEEPLAVCTASMDELVYPFYFHRELTPEGLRGFESLRTGVASEGEYIEVRVCPMGDVAQSPILANLAGLKLLEKITRRTF